MRLRDGGTLGFDQLVLATGSVYSYFGHDDWPRVAPGLKSLDDATHIRRRLLLAFEHAENRADESERQRLLTFVIIGAGPDGRPLPGAAPVAKQQGRYVAELIRRRVRGQKKPPPFRYRDQGALATIGRSSAVADLPHLKLTGGAGWVLWSIVHIYFLIDFRNRMAVFLNWVSAWLTYARGARLITGDDRRD